MNKKGFFPGSSYIAGFFIIMVLTVFIIGFFDFTIVEVYEPVHEILNESLVNDFNKTDTEAYAAFEENYDNTKGMSLPFNFLFIFVTLYGIYSSALNVINTKKMSPFGLIFKTIGGMIFFIYIIQLIVMKIIVYLQVQIVDYLFDGLIATHVPFYLVLYNNIGVFALAWGLALILLNQFLGKVESEFGGVFGNE